MSEGTSRLLEVLHEGATEAGEQDRALLLSYGELLLRSGPLRLLSELPPDAVYALVKQCFHFAARRSSALFSLRLSDAPATRESSLGALGLVQLVVQDRPFLIDSMQALLMETGLRVWAILHPVLHVERDEAGRMTAVHPHRPGAANEAHMVFVTDPVQGHQRQPLLEDLRAVLQDVVHAVDDFPQLRTRLAGVRELTRQSGDTALIDRMLSWFEDDNFIFLGALPYRAENDTLHALTGEGLGLFNPALERMTHHEALQAQAGRYLEHLATPAPFFVVEETGVVSRVHRRTRMSALLLSAEPAGPGRNLLAVVGVFTHRSLRADVMEIPGLAEKLRAAVKRLDVAPGGHKHKELLDFLNGLPRFDLFRLSENALDAMLGYLLTVVDEPRRDARLLQDPETGSLRVLALVPEPDVPHETQQAVRERLEEMLGHTAQIAFAVSLNYMAVLVVVFQRASAWHGELPDAEAVRQAVMQELLGRDERLVARWAAERGTPLDERLARSLVAALPPDYKVAHEDAEVLEDLSNLRRMLDENLHQFVLRPVPRSEAVRLVLYTWEKLPLSRVMPVLTHLRVHVVEESAYAVALAERPVYLQTFLLEPPAGLHLRPEVHGPLLRELIFGVLSARQEDDPLAALVLACDLDVRHVNLLRLYRNYLMQVGAVYTRNTINGTLIRRPAVTRALLSLFDARFNPEHHDRRAREEAARTAMNDAEREIDNLTEDRIFKALANLMSATVRTNFYTEPAPTEIAVKLASAEIEQLAPPRPLYEVYVYGALLEGIHLRADRVARGGIRYSDRPDDFRTEVLGLMATQTKKNALIVPVGAKGGFVVKDLAPYHGDARAAGDAQYRAFIGALLSVTDNRVEGRVRPPPRVVRHDADDPYLVVAADKGTAHLSDTANAVAQEHGFWLGDAFASGGSNGYDHKGIGITARGAWEGVKRHFWERGVDVQRDPVTAVGIGDMSGDVFGNGMLLSRTLRLVGAFDHRNVFIDPEPDAERSYAERERLFHTPGTTWTDYDTRAMGPGGGVYARSAKEIVLSDEARRLLGTDRAAMSGEELIRALLTLDVDLLWNGGIGTYVKAAGESHAQVGDPNNDAVRVDAGAVRARVVGEGGNLGLTQAARIDLDGAGCGVNSDAIDNAGGVNMSDHEVNLKTLLDTLLRDGQLDDEAERTRALRDATEDVTGAILHANFRQVLLLSLEQQRSRASIGALLRLVELLARQGGLDRRLDTIPSAERMQQLYAAGRPQARPVLAVLLAHTKMAVSRALVASALVNEPYLFGAYRGYFPRAIAEGYDLHRVTHPVQREIIATVLTNRVVDQAGLTFIPETAELTSQPWDAVVQAYLLADQVADAPALRSQVYALADRLPTEHQYALLLRLEDVLAEMTRWFLLSAAPAERAFTAAAELHEAFGAYVSALPGLLQPEQQEVVAGQQDELTRLGFAPDAASVAALLPYLHGFLRVHRLGTEAGIPLEQAYTLAATADERLRLSALAAALRAAAPTDRWQKAYGDTLQRSLERLRRSKLQAILADRQGDTPEAWVDAWLAAREPAWRNFETTVQQALNQEPVGLVPLAVAIGLLEGL